LIFSLALILFISKDKLEKTILHLKNDLSFVVQCNTISSRSKRVWHKKNFYGNAEFYFDGLGTNDYSLGAIDPALLARLARGEQSMILLNRRGYARSLLCRSCGHAFSCPDCSISMTYHQERNLLLCHYCGIEAGVPSSCSNCGAEYIYFVASVPEQLEEVLRKLLPRARLARLDYCQAVGLGDLHVGSAQGQVLRGRPSGQDRWILGRRLVVCRAGRDSGSAGHQRTGGICKGVRSAGPGCSRTCG
jgi:hypothetical protein